jgi:hypothetical protein
MQAARNLVRKQYMMGPRQVKKLERLAKRDKVSAAHIVRTAVDCYDPEHDADGATLASVVIPSGSELSRHAQRLMDDCGYLGR